MDKSDKVDNAFLSLKKAKFTWFPLEMEVQKQKMKHKICSKCGCKIPKDEKIAIFNKKILCQSCYSIRNDKPASIPAWYEKWVKKKEDIPEGVKKDE